MDVDTLVKVIAAGGTSGLLAIGILIFKIGRFTGEINRSITALQRDVRSQEAEVNRRFDEQDETIAGKFSSLDGALKDFRENQLESARTEVILTSLRTEVALVRQRTHDLSNKLVLVMSLPDEIKEVKRLLLETIAK